MGIEYDNDPYGFYEERETLKRSKSSSPKLHTPKSGNVENYLQENLLAVCGNDEIPFGYITREYFDNFVASDNFSNYVIVDIKNKNSYDCNGEGNVIGSRVSNNIESQYTIYSAFGQIPEQDLFGDAIEVLIPQVEPNKDNYIGIPVNIAYLSLIDDNIRKFHSITDPNKLQLESNIEKLIKTAILDPDQFDEIFTVETDRPESPLMRKFLIKLAQLVNEGLETLEDEGLENITELQKEAYKYAGYKGKTFETVIEEYKDYDSYLRFLLMKDEKVVITEEQKEYFDKLKVLVKKEASHLYSMLPINKKKNKDVEVKGISPAAGLAGTLYFTGLVPSLTNFKSEIRATYFTYVENIHDIYDEIEESKLSFKIALNFDLISEKNGELKKGVEIKNFIFVCDKNFNYAFFEVKKSTLNKWKKSLGEKISAIVGVISNKVMTPRGFNEFVL